MLMQLVLTVRAWMGQSPPALLQQGLAWAANLASGLRHFSLRANSITAPTRTAVFNGAR